MAQFPWLGKPLQRDVRNHHLRPCFVSAFQRQGINLLYEWQAAALREAVGKNFVYQAPTSGEFTANNRSLCPCDLRSSHHLYHSVGSLIEAGYVGGKSLVADVLMLQRLQNAITDWRRPDAKALVLVPYLSIGKQSKFLSGGRMCS
jgi:hypothetical protein